MRSHYVEYTVDDEVTIVNLITEVTLNVNQLCVHVYSLIVTAKIFG